MKIFKILVIILLLTFFIQGEERVITAEGNASGSGESAKEKAIEDALRNAIEIGYGVFIDSATLVENAALISDDTISQTKGFIKSYDVIDGSVENDITSVKVKAVISMDKIWESDSLLLLLKRMGAPRFIILSSESANGGQIAEDPALQKMTELLVKRGFTLVNAINVNDLSFDQRKKYVSDLNSSLKFAQKFDAEIIVLLDAQATFEKKAMLYGKEMIYFNGIVKSKVVRIDSGIIVSSSAGKSIRGGTTPEEAIFDTIQFAAEDSSDNLIRGVLKSWADMLNMGRFIEVVIKNISVSELTGIIDAISSVDGVSQVNQRSYSNRTAYLEVKSKHKAMYLAGSFESIYGKKLEVLNFTSNKIVLKKK